MARPKKNNAEYFPHFTSMRNHRKVKVLRNKFGSVLGYAFWCMMLEWLTEQDGLEWEFSALECEMFAAELGVSAAEIPPMIDLCLQIELLFKTETGFIYSESLNEELAPLFAKRNRERSKSKTRERRENGAFSGRNTTSEGVSAAETPQSRVEENRVEKSRENVLLKKEPKSESDSEIEKLNCSKNLNSSEIPDTSNLENSENSVLTQGGGAAAKKAEIPAPFLEAHKLYYSGKKRSVETEFKHLKKSCKNFKEVLEVLEQLPAAVETFKKQMEAERRESSKIKYMQGWITARSWEIYSSRDGSPETYTVPAAPTAEATKPKDYKTMLERQQNANYL